MKGPTKKPIQMITMWTRSLLFKRVIAFLLIFLVIFSASTSLITLRTAKASGWAGWDAIDTIYYDPTQDDPTNKFLEQVATELRDDFQKVGKTLTIATSSRPDSGSIYLEVNSNHPDLTGRNDEAFKLYSDANGLYITGKTPLAVRHGTYTLLDKLGFRWFFKHPAWWVVPEALIDPGVLNEVQEPFYVWRNIGQLTYTDAEKGSDWCRKNRTYGSEYYYVAESYAQIINRSEFATHPEWFLPEDMVEVTYPWQLRCDNPDVVARAIAYAYNILPQTRNSGNGIIPYASVAISPNDGTGWDPPWSDRQVITDKVFYLANEVAKAIKDDFPDKYVGVFSYADYSLIPSFDLEANLLVEVATALSFGGLSLDERIQGVQARGAQVGIRDYLDIWEWYHDSPSLMPDKLNDLRHYANLGVKVYYGENQDGWGSRGTVYYAASKLLWDPYSDLDAILDDFYTKAFGPAAEVMKSYYSRYDYGGQSVLPDNILLENFRDLAEAESLATGNDEILERIRQLEYYQRYLWLWARLSNGQMTLDEVKAFYTFNTKIRYDYLIFYTRLEAYLRSELKNLGLTDSEINALQDFTPPTTTEAAAWLSEAITDLEKAQLVPLGNTTYPRLEPMYGSYRTVVIPSDGNENITVMVKGLNGTLQWISPTGNLIDTWSFSSELTDWTPVTFHADIAGEYHLHIASSALYLDVQGRGAAILASPKAANYFGDWVTDAPYYSGRNEFYFYVPQGTDYFTFCPIVHVPERPAFGELTDPDDVEYPFSFDKTTEWVFNNPAPGVWKIGINMNPLSCKPFYLSGISALVWHDPKYLLVPSGVLNNSPPIANSQSVTTDEDLPVAITLDASDPDDDPLTYAIASNPSHGSLSGTPPVVTYTPNPNYNGSDSFTYRANDGQANSNTATVTISISAVDDPPVLSAIGNKSVNEGQLLQFTVSGTDADNDPLTYSANPVSLPQGADFNSGTQTFSWTPAYGQAGIYNNVQFTVSDGLLTDSEDINITVEAASPNPPPAGGGGGASGGGGGGTNGVTSLYYSVSNNGTFLEDVTVESADGIVTLYIPKNTVGLSRTGFPLTSLSILDGTTAPSPPKDAQIVGLAYDIGPGGATFNPPIDLTFKYAEAEVPQGVAEKNLVLATYDWDSEQWQDLESATNPDQNTITTKLSHFSTYAILAYTRPASFEVTEFSVAPRELELGNDVSISCALRNTGDLTGSYEVSLELDGVVIQTREVTLDGGDSETLNFSATPETSGEHKVGIGNLLETFTVREPEAPAAFVTNALNVTPTEVSLGDSVTIAVLVSNTGELTGSYEAVLKIDDVIVQTKQVTITGGDSQIAIFNITPDTPGQYRVNVDGLEGIYEVNAPSLPAAVEVSNTGPGIASFNVTPIFDTQTGKLVSARIYCQLSESRDLTPESELTLKVFFEGELLEERSLLSTSQLAPDENTVSVGYIPSLGWKTGLYSFQAALSEGGSFIQSTEQYQFTVTPESITRVVSWKTLGMVVGATLIMITALVAVILYRRREMLRDYLE
jgi:hypothetical protein